MFLLYYFRPSGGASTFALRLMLLPPLPLPLWYAWLGDDILHPCDWILTLLDLFKSFYMCYMRSYFQTDSFHSGMAYLFLCGFIYIYSRITLKVLEFIRKWNLSFLDDLA